MFFITCTNHCTNNLQRVELAEKSRDEINELLTSRGFTEKVESNEMDEEAPEQEEDADKPNERIEF